MISGGCLIPHRRRAQPSRWHSLGPNRTLIERHPAPLKLKESPHSANLHISSHSRARLQWPSLFLPQPLSWRSSLNDLEGVGKRVTTMKTTYGSPALAEASRSSTILLTKSWPRRGTSTRKASAVRYMHTHVCPLQNLTCFCADLAEALVRPAADATLVLQNGKGVQAAAPSALSRDSLCHPSHPEASFALLWSHYTFQDLLRPGRLCSGRRELG